ncbi:MAG: hypothetical protein Q9184_004797 [Pyrenodesmia sp. 2 TL-2023]
MAPHEVSIQDNQLADGISTDREAGFEALENQSNGHTKLLPPPDHKSAAPLHRSAKGYKNQHADADGLSRIGNTDYVTIADRVRCGEETELLKGQKPGQKFVLTIAGYRKEGLSEEEYRKYMTEVHSPMIHNTSTTRPLMAKIFDPQFANIMQYDCFIQATFTSIQDVMAMKADPYFKKYITPDHENFADTRESQPNTAQRHPLSAGSIADFSGPSRMTIGYLEEFIADGKVKEEPEDLDVILARQDRILRAREEKRKGKVGKRCTGNENPPRTNAIILPFQKVPFAALSVNSLMLTFCSLPMCTIVSMNTFRALPLPQAAPCLDHETPQRPNAVPKSGIPERKRFRKPSFSTEARTSRSPMVCLADWDRSCWFVAPMKIRV